MKLRNLALVLALATFSFAQDSKFSFPPAMAQRFARSCAPDVRASL